MVGYFKLVFREIVLDKKKEWSMQWEYLYEIPSRKIKYQIKRWNCRHFFLSFFSWNFVLFRRQHDVFQQ